MSRRSPRGDRSPAASVAFLLHSTTVIPPPAADRPRSVLAALLIEGRTVGLSPSEFARGQRGSEQWTVTQLAGGYVAIDRDGRTFACWTEREGSVQHHYGRRLSEAERCDLLPRLERDADRRSLQLGRWFAAPALAAPQPEWQPGSAQLVVIAGLRQQLSAGTIVIYEGMDAAASAASLRTSDSPLGLLLAQFIASRERVPLVAARFDQDELIDRLSRTQVAPELPADVYEHLTAERDPLLDQPAIFGGQEDDLFRILWKEGRGQRAKCYVTCLRWREQAQLEAELERLQSGDSADGPDRRAA